MNHPRVQAVLFDLDGTLIDSAPDLGAAGNVLRARRGLAPLPLSHYRPMTGTGARGMVGVALQIGMDHPDFEAAKHEFLQAYEADMTAATCVFAAMAPVLDQLDARCIPWGIVTNKHSRYAEPIVQALNLAERSRVLICGDTTPHAKPHPEPLFEAARRLSMAPQACFYVGDDLRDIQAGRAAGMSTVAAAWGYLGQGDAVDQWGADFLIDSPEQLLNLAPLA